MGAGKIFPERESGWPPPMAKVASLPMIVEEKLLPVFKAHQQANYL